MARVEIKAVGDHTARRLTMRFYFTWRGQYMGTSYVKVEGALGVIGRTGEIKAQSEMPGAVWSPTAFSSTLAVWPRRTHLSII